MKKERSKELFSPESCSPVLSGGIRDFTVHGTEPVPLHIYHQDYAHGGLSVPFHWHKELEWIWVEKGTLTLTLKTETRTISEGTFLFINSHELHQLCSIGTTPSVHHALVFLPEILSCAYLDSCEADWIRPLLSHQLLLPAFPLEELSAAEASSQTQKTFVLTLSELFQEILYAYDTKPIGWFLLIKSDMYRILALLAQYQLFLHPEPLCTRKKERSDQCKKLLRYIQDNYDSKIRLSDLAAILNMNPQYFCRFFKTHFHTTPISYINQYRVTQAADLFLPAARFLSWKLLWIPDLKAPAILPAFSAGLLVCHRKNIEKPCPDPANFSVPFLYLRKDKSLSYTAKHQIFSF